MSKEEPELPDLEGNLLKLKHKTTIFGSWTRRWFRINSNNLTLEYFRSKPRNSLQHPAGEMPLNSIISINPFDDCCFQIKGYEKTFFLKASSKAEQACWLRNLGQYINEKRDMESRAFSMIGNEENNNNNNNINEEKENYK